MLISDLLYHLKQKMKKKTRFIQNSCDDKRVNNQLLNTINPPLFHASTVLFDSCEDLLKANAGEYKGAVYGTDRLPLQVMVEEAINELESGAITRVFPSGISAIQHSLLAFVDSGQHVLMVENAYSPTKRFSDRVMPRFGIEVEYVPGDIGAEIEERIRPETAVIFLESPGSNTFEIQDIRAIAEIAREKGILTVIDNTWATPLFLQPLSLGLDISIQSVTKYLSGHSDVLMGSVTANEACSARLTDYYRDLEIFAGQEECYKALRGIKTLALRLKQHQASALELATWLEKQPQVEQVLHPALPSHPQHKLWQRDFSGASGLFAMIPGDQYSERQLANFVNALQLFGIGYSWGGYKSLVTLGRYDRSSTNSLNGKYVLRFNIGLEDVGDLQNDIAQALDYLEK